MIRTTVAALAAVAFAFLMGQPAVAADPPPGALRILETNIASGHHCDLGDGCTETLEQRIAAFGPDVVAGEEFCQADLDEFARIHATWEVASVSILAPGDTLNGCGDDTKVQLIAGPNMTGRSEHSLPGDQVFDTYTRVYKMLCARTAADSTRHCVVHLRSGQDPADIRAREAQVDKILEVTGAWAARHTISGDFNLRTDDKAFKKLIAAGYVDIVPGRVTHVLAKGRITATGGRTWDQPKSDHPLTQAWVDWAR